ncbi:MAG: hypothetical protein IJV99_03295 [Clostridia bacterium]|nr:hypothetical protein [Clostridia bacterium]
MKKLLITILSVLLMLSAVGLFACSEEDTYTTKVNQKTWETQIEKGANNFWYNDGQGLFDNGAYINLNNEVYNSKEVDGELKYYKIDSDGIETEITKNQFLVPVDIVDDMFGWLKNNYSAFTYNDNYNYIYSNTTGQAEVPELGVYFVEAYVLFNSGKLTSVLIATLPVGADPATAPELPNHRFDRFGSVLFDYSFEKRFNEMSNYVVKINSSVENIEVNFTEDKIFAHYPNNPIGKQEQYWHKDTSGENPKYIYYVKNANGIYDKDMTRTEEQYNGVRKGLFDMFVTNMINAENLEIKNGKIVNKANITAKYFMPSVGTMDATFKNIVATLDETLSFSKLTYKMTLSMDGYQSLTYTVTITVGNAIVNLPTEFNLLCPYVESDITEGLNITAENYHYQVAVSGNMPVIVVVDGNDVSKKLGTELTSIVYKNNKYYNYAPNTYLKDATTYDYNTGKNGLGDKITWDKEYYKEVEITENGEMQRNAIRDLYKTYIPTLTGMFSEFNFDGEKLIAPSLTIETVTYTNFTISFYADKTVKEISYVLNAGEPNIQEIKITFAYYTRPIDKPEYIVSYYGDEPNDMKANAPTDTFSLTADNFVGYFHELGWQRNFKIEKAGNLIKYTTYEVKEVESETYYEKFYDSYYKYTLNSGVWTRNTCTKAEYDEIANKMYTVVCNINPTYAACKDATKTFWGWQCTGKVAQTYSVTGTSSELFMYVLVVNDKVDKIITRASQNRLEHEINFYYGAAVVNLPTDYVTES